jgi:sorbitol-specific phosphotransferase system component IIA
VDDLEAVVPLIIPSEIALVRGETTVDVRIDIDPIQNSTVFIAGVLMRNLPPGMTATLSPTSVQVLLIGSADSLRELGPTDIRAEVDLSNRAPGTHQVQPTVLIPPGIEVASVVPGTVALTLRLLPTPTATPVPTATPSPTPSEVTGDERAPDADLTRTAAPIPTNAPTPTPTRQAAAG